MIVAIDGPSASGKSTVSRAVAERLGFGYLDTGAMYRAVALAALRSGTRWEDEAALGQLARDAVIRFERGAGQRATTVILNGDDVTEAIRMPDVTQAVSPVSKVPAVREAMVAEQRALAGNGDWVVEGRDIGTVVFPRADVKVFLTASVDERARRRKEDFLEAGLDVEHGEVVRTIESRDMIDSTREAAPLVRADDAVEVDTTTLTIEQVVDLISELAGGT